MSKAKFQAAQGAQQSSGSFATGFLLGQLTLALILFCFIKFFIFGEAPSSDVRASIRATSRRQRTLSHAHKRTLSSALLPRPSSGVIKQRTDGGVAAQKILEKTYYHVHGHQPESLDWFNVLVAQTIAQLRADAQEDEAVLSSLTAVLNGTNKPDFVDDIKVTEISLGDEFPIFSNCRVIPVDENGTPIKELKGNRGEMLQARMDVDLSDVVTLGVETKLVVNYPKPSVLVLPVALAVSVVRFSATLAVSFSPSSTSPLQTTFPEPAPSTGPSPADGLPATSPKNEGHPLNPTGKSPTTLTFTFLDDYRLDLSVHSLIGSRSKLQDVPKIAQLVEDRIHRWFDDRCVEPRFQQIVLPSLWPRKRNTRGGADGDGAVDDVAQGAFASRSQGSASGRDGTAIADDSTPPAIPVPSVPISKKEGGVPANASSSLPPPPPPPPQSMPASMAEQRTRDWAASQQHGKASTAARDEGLSELEIAGREMREADEREQRRRRQQQQQQQQQVHTNGADGVRLRPGWEAASEAKMSS